MGEKLLTKKAADDKTNKEDQRLIKLSLCSALSESMYVLLPLIAIAIVLFAKGSLLDIFKQAEWAFGAIVLSGQSITKIILAISRAKTPSHKISAIIVVVTLIITLLLVPSLIVLSLMLTLTPVPISLLILQIILFIVALLVFLFLHTAAEYFQVEHDFRSANNRQT